MTKKSYKKGLTLIELIIYIGIVSLVVVILIDLSINLVYAQRKSNSGAEIQQNANLIIERLTSSITNAESISGVYPSNQLDLVVNGSPVTYVLNGNVFQIVENGNPAVPLSNSQVVISPPQGDQIFTKVTNDTAISVKINLIISLTTDINKKETVTTSVTLRGI